MADFCASVYHFNLFRQHSLPFCVFAVAPISSWLLSPFQVASLKESVRSAPTQGHLQYGQDTVQFQFLQFLRQHTRRDAQQVSLYVGETIDACDDCAHNGQPPLAANGIHGVAYRKGNLLTRHPFVAVSLLFHI